MYSVEHRLGLQHRAGLLLGRCNRTTPVSIQRVVQAVQRCQIAHRVACRWQQRDGSFDTCPYTNLLGRGYTEHIGCSAE